MTIRSGLEILREKGYKPLQGQRVGLLTNPSAVDNTLNSAYNILCSDDRVNVVAIFAPEHGFAGAITEGESITHQTDPRTGLPVYSLYGENLSPTAEMLESLDVIVVDIQDIGVRYYTYTWTVSHLLETAAKNNITVVLLDRPNPLGGTNVYGPPLMDDYKSLVGRYPVPVIHGMTLGEMIWMVNEAWNPHLARLSIIPCEGWRREMRWEDCALPWVPTSPNMPNLKTLHHYPGACLLEGTNLSEGRGTTLPFEVLGAPWIDSYKLAEHLNEQDWILDCGVRFRPHTFKPTYSKYTGEYCEGVQAHITDPDGWNPIKTWLGAIAEVHHMYPQQFEWTPNHPGTGYSHFDRLVGSRKVRDAIENGTPISRLIPDWLVKSAQFSEDRKPFLLYY